MENELVFAQLVRFYVKGYFTKDGKVILAAKI
jgi:hypothetical protein